MVFDVIKYFICMKSIGIGAATYNFHVDQNDRD